MVAHDHHLAYMWVIGVIFILTVAGAYMLKSPDALTGHVVYEPVHVCGSCTGSPVCAVKEGSVMNYENACAAACDGARVIHDDVCERI